MWAYQSFDHRIFAVHTTSGIDGFAGRIELDHLRVVFVTVILRHQYIPSFIDRDPGRLRDTFDFLLNRQFWSELIYGPAGVTCDIYVTFISQVGILLNGQLPQAGAGNFHFGEQLTLAVNLSNLLCA